jgi:thiol-disulfide isomerase/thioredoxin
MKFRLFVLSLLGAAMLAGSASGANESQAGSAKAELEALKTLMSSRPERPLSPRENYLWFDGLTRKISAEAFSFIENHPHDPLRWEAALILQQSRFHPRFVVSIDEQYPEGGESAVTRDTAAEAAYEARVVELEKAMRAATDVPVVVQEQMAFGDLMPLFYPAFDAMRAEQIPDLTAIEPAFLGFLERFPESESGRGLMPMYVQLAMKQAEPKTEVEVLQRFTDSPNHHTRAYVKDRVRFFELSKQPFELAFTAIDGREVDLKALRGKVVLIDFWATWCGPCIAELPNVKKVYADYHDKGFEIIGVSLDDEKDRQKFIDLVKEEGTTWPQRFEGKGWRDPLVKTYTISGIPAMFLLDQNGMLVSTNARGEKLGEEVKRLLKL